MVCSFALGGIERIEMLKENTLSINHTLNLRFFIKFFKEERVINTFVLLANKYCTIIG